MSSQHTDHLDDLTKINTKLDKKHLHKVVTGSAAGTLVEWFDFALFGYMAFYIAGNFFPSEDRVAGLLATFAVFLVSFILRPIGGVYFGKLGDKLGRKKILALTVLLMSGSTAAIGFIPSYDSIGIWAPALLILARIVQGLSAGGEYTGATIYTVEHSPQNKRNSYSWTMVATTFVAFALAAGLSALLVNTLGEEVMMAWGWRIVFLIAIPMGAVAFYIRGHLEESPEFEMMRKSKKDHGSYSTKQVMKTEGGNVIKLSGVVALYALSFYIFSTYMNTFLKGVIGLSSGTALSASLISLLFAACITPFAGIISDKVGRRKMLLFACIWHVLLVIPAYMLVATGANFISAIIGMGILGIGVAVIGSVVAVQLSEMFSTDMRYTASGMCYNFSFAIFGGTAPYVATWMTANTGNYLSPAIYVTVVAVLVTFWVLFFIPETANKPLRRFHTEPQYGKENFEQPIAMSTTKLDIAA
ncbi:MAG: MHS family MFS transporter [Alcaligenaceae bacterium]|nr:MHS family MFS transporter [Alcaligenaceae bacterium]